MKSPEKTQNTPESKAQHNNINYSMLPPQKLPNWLLDKNTPAKVYNFSMHAPSTQPQVFEYVQEKELVSKEVPTNTQEVPFLAVQPIVTENERPTPKIIPDLVSTTPEDQNNATETTDFAESNIQDQQEEIDAIANAPALDSDIIPAMDTTPETNENIQPITNEGETGTEEGFKPLETNFGFDAETLNNTTHKTELDANISENFSEPVLILTSQNPPAVSPAPHVTAPILVEPPQPPPHAIQQAYPPHFTPPESKSFANWMLNNSNTATIILVGIILFSILIMMLVMFDII